MKNITVDFSALDCRTAVALGVFDGVHLGHRMVIDRAVSLCGDDIKPAVFTFRSDTVVNKGKERLLTDAEKQRKLSQRGVEYILSPDFGDVRELEAEDFVREILVGRLRCRYAVCGKDFRFGKGAKGNTALLTELGKELGFETIVLDKLALAGETVSSTKIKEHIRSGEILRANELLGYRFAYREPVIHGMELARTWDFPTINQRLPERVTVPRFGVYCSRVKLDGQRYTGVTNIGIKPTVGRETAPLAETFIIGYHGDLYGRVVKVELERFIRPEKKFASIDELRRQIELDTAEAEKKLFIDG